MADRLIVKNFGPIIDAELDIKKTTVFIGPQGSGKSTLAKLVAIISKEKYLYTPRRIEHADLDFYGILSFNKTDCDIKFIGEKDIVVKTDEVFNPNYDILKYQKELVFMPTERHLIGLISESIWSLMSNKIALPDFIIKFGQFFELAKKNISTFKSSVLGVEYRHISGKDYVYFGENESILLNESASGFQSTMPMILVVESFVNQGYTQFIIEEPELNLYPTTQKSLIYYLADRCTKGENDLLMTTHSPYILAALNNLLFAYKTAQKHPEKADEVAKIIPRESWLNPAEFAAYFVAEGTARSIINPKTGLISENELDGVSEDFKIEFDELVEIYRLPVHERVH